MPDREVFSLTSSGKKREERGKNGSETQISDFINLLFYLSLVKNTPKQDSEPSLNKISVGFLIYSM